MTYPLLLSGDCSELLPMTPEHRHLSCDTMREHPLRRFADHHLAVIRERMINALCLAAIIGTPCAIVGKTALDRSNQEYDVYLRENERINTIIRANLERMAAGHDENAPSWREAIRSLEKHRTRAAAQSDVN